MNRARESGASGSGAGTVSADGAVVRGRRLAMLAAAGLAVVIGVGLPARISAAQGVAEGVASDTASRSAGGAKEAQPMEAPPMAASVKRLLDQDYLNAAEKAALRVKHGVWTEADLTSTELKARAAVAVGDLGSAALMADDAPAVLQAHACVLRGEPGKAIEILDGIQAGGGGVGDRVYAARLRAQALVDLGRGAEAVKVLAGAVNESPAEGMSADETVELVRCLLMLSRMVDQKSMGGDGIHQQMLAALARVRTELDPNSANAVVCEAEVLIEKGKYEQAAEAAEQALGLNPRLAAAWAILGNLAADTFNPQQAESIAARLDVLADKKNPEAALMRARSMLRDDAELAEPLIAGALERFPGHRGALAMRAAVAAARFDYAEADARLKALDAVAPGDARGALMAGSACGRQYEDATRYFTMAAERAPFWADPWIELGLNEMQAGRNDAALPALARAVELDPYNVRADNSLKLVREIANYASIESDHFVVRHKPGIDAVMAREMPGVLEKIFTRVTGNGPGGIDHKPAHKTVVELYPNHQWFAVRITGLPQLHTIAAATGPVIAMEVPREGPGHMDASFDWARVVQHEYTHTVTLSRTKNRLPHWFTEASAVYLEDRPFDWNIVQLLARVHQTDTYFDFDTINVMFARPIKPTDRTQAYMQGAWMYRYMIERFGQNAPLELMDLYATGETEERAFAKVLKVERGQFLKDFKKWASEQLVAWGMHEGEGTPTLATLIEKAKGDAAEGVEIPNSPTDEMLAGWLAESVKAGVGNGAGNPFVLEEMLMRKSGGGKKLSADGIALAKEYAKARPVDPLPRRLLASLYLSSDATRGEAVEHLEWLDLREQKTPSFAVELSRIYASAGDFTKAVEKAQRATQIAPYNATLREHAAAIALRAGDLKGAAWQIEALQLLEPENPAHKKRMEAVKKRMGG